MTEENQQVFDLVSPDQADIRTRADNLIDQETRAVINSNQDLETAGDLVKFLKGLKKKAEEKRKDLVKPLNDTVKKINAEWKLITDPIDKAVKSAVGKMSVYTTEQEKIIEAERKKAIKEAEEKALAEAEQATDSNEAEQIINDAAQQTAIAANTKVKTKVHGNYGSTTFTKKIRKWRVTDIKSIPDQYLMIDESAIKDALRQYKTIVDGVADRDHLKGKEREAFITEKMKEFQIDGIEFYFENQVNVR